MGPDPYPERGIHNITLWLGVSKADATKAQKLADSCNHGLFYQPSNCHTGSLPMENSLLKVDSDHIVVSAVVPGEDGSILVRVYENAGKAGEAVISFTGEIASAEAVKLSGEVVPGKAAVNGSQVTLSVDARSIAAVKVTLK